MQNRPKHSSIGVPLLTWARENLTPQAFAAFFHLVEIASTHSDLVAYCGDRELGQALKRTRNSVRSLIDELIAAGAVQLLRRGDGRQRSKYRILRSLLTAKRRAGKRTANGGGGELLTPWGSKIDPPIHIRNTRGKEQQNTAGGTGLHPRRGGGPVEPVFDRVVVLLRQALPEGEVQRGAAAVVRHVRKVGAARVLAVVERSLTAREPVGWALAALRGGWQFSDKGKRDPAAAAAEAEAARVERTRAAAAAAAAARKRAAAVDRMVAGLEADDPDAAADLRRQAEAAAAAAGLAPGRAGWEMAVRARYRLGVEKYSEGGE